MIVTDPEVEPKKVAFGSDTLVVKDALSESTVDPEPVEVNVPVPPDVTGSAEPDKVMARVPVVVRGEPVVVRNDGVVIPTEVTVPPPRDPKVVHFS